MTISGSAGEIDGDYDVVVANILAAPLIELARPICERVKSNGMLVLSGILAEQADDVTAAYAQFVDFDEPRFREQNGQTWTRLSGRKR